MQISLQPSVRYVTHQMLNTMKSQINVCCVVHGQKNTSQNLQNQTLSSLNSPVIIRIQIRRGGIVDQMILHYSLNGLIPQTITLFFHRNFHLIKVYCVQKKKNNKCFCLVQILRFSRKNQIQTRVSYARESHSSHRIRAFF